MMFNPSLGLQNWVIQAVEILAVIGKWSGLEVIYVGSFLEQTEYLVKRAS